MSSPEKLSTGPVNNPSTHRGTGVRISYMRSWNARQDAENLDRQRARGDALNILAALDGSEIDARIFISGWRARRLRDALIILAATIPQETPTSRIGRAA